MAVAVRTALEFVYSQFPHLGRDLSRTRLLESGISPSGDQLPMPVAPSPTTPDPEAVTGRERFARPNPVPTREPRTATPVTSDGDVLLSVPISAPPVPPTEEVAVPPEGPLATLVENTQGLGFFQEALANHTGSTGEQPTIGNNNRANSPDTGPPRSE
ncbi:MAG TPA: hypothetical protein VLA88_03860 [Candidatus Saccharimonadales bacterium]|nr:hypothetical protein [Candidatus Saccharimonadales bacterium]